MLSFNVANLLIPDEPQKFVLNLPSGTWTLEQHPDYSRSKHAMTRGQCAHTYILEHPADIKNGSGVVDRAFEEVTAILLGASYFSGLSVTIKTSTLASEVSILHPSDHWPRERALDKPSPCIVTTAEFAGLLERFVDVWPKLGVTEKARLLVHHWLDALGCWSMEDLYLSATTLLQIIVATEASKQGKPGLSYYQGVSDAAARAGIRPLSNDFKNMRNELIHDGQLIGKRFIGPDKIACASVVADVLNWFDEYLHSALALGSPRKLRFGRADLVNLNAYSID